jgi:hypothetical protein
LLLHGVLSFKEMRFGNNWERGATTRERALQTDETAGAMTEKKRRKNLKPNK